MNDEGLVIVGYAWSEERCMNEHETLSLEILESRLEMETISSQAAAPWLPIECRCDNK
jgi:hypothetical protein